MKPLHVLLAALSFVLCTHASRAERTPPRRSTPNPTTADIIVSFRPGATVLRMHTLAAGADPAAVRDTMARRAAALGARIGRALEGGNVVSERMQVVRARGIDAATLAAALAADPEVEFAVPSGRKRLLAAPNDPLYPALPRVNLAQQSGGPDSGQWYLRPPTAIEVAGIDIESAWLQTSGDATVTVAVLDTGILAHPDLAGRTVPGFDFVSDLAAANDNDGWDADPTDPGDWVTAADVAPGTPLAALGCTSADVGNSSWHGTGTASLIGAATGNGIGMAGAAPSVRVLPVRVLGKCGGSDADIQAAMRWAAGIDLGGVPKNMYPAKVISMSLGSAGACDPTYQSAVDDVLAKGVVIVAAAGNDSLAVGSPANCQGVIAVAGVRHVGTKAGYSDLGPEVAIAAPAGNCVNSTGPCLYPVLIATNTGVREPLASSYTDSFNYSVGTSFSAPLVAGSAALMFSVQPSLTPAGVLAGLTAGARPFPASGVAPDPVTGPIVACRASSASAQGECYCTMSTCGAGLLDAGAAVRAALGASLTITVSPAAPVAGQAITLSGVGSTVGPGRSIAGWQWSLVDAGSTGSSLVGSVTDASTTLQSAAAGTVTVQLVMTDDLNVAVAARKSITVAAAAGSEPLASSGGGGGALSWLWALALLVAAAALARLPRAVQRGALATAMHGAKPAPSSGWPSARNNVACAGVALSTRMRLSLAAGRKAITFAPRTPDLPADASALSAAARLS
jgi:serine protease